MTVNINLDFAHAFFIHKGCVRSGNGYAGIKQNFAGEGIRNRLRKGKACNSSFKSKLFVVFIAADSGNVVSSCIEEQVMKMLLTGFHRGRLAGTKLAVNLKQGFFS